MWEKDLAEKVVDPLSSEVIPQLPWREVCRGALATRKLKLKSHSALAAIARQQPAVATWRCSARAGPSIRPSEVRRGFTRRLLPLHLFLRGEL